MNKQLTIYDALADSLIGQTAAYTTDNWQSDWNGDEVGFPDIPVVGLYSIPEQPIYYYVNTESGEILEAWYVED